MRTQLKTQFKNRQLTSLALMLTIFPVILNGCFGKEEKTCVAEDQRGAFMAPVRAFPIQVVADQRFKSSEYSQIAAAVAEWNAITQQALGRPFFNLVSHAVPPGIRDADPKDCNKKLGNEGEFFIVREDSNSHWQSLGFKDSVPGATVRCQRGNDIEHQIILVNLNLLSEPTQLQNVMLHELGHSIGLDHSCLDSGDKADFKSCSSFGANHAYRLAVMYPYLTSERDSRGQLQTKTKLQENDRARTACLYEPE